MQNAMKKYNRLRTRRIINNLQSATHNPPSISNIWVAAKGCLRNKHLSLLCILLFLPLLSFAQEPSSEPAVSFDTGAPGNLYYQDASLTVKMTFPQGKGPRPLSVTVKVLDDRSEELERRSLVIPEGNPPSLKHKLGELNPGFYTCIAELMYEKGKREIGFMKFAVIRKPRDIFLPEESPFGVDAFVSWCCLSKDSAQKVAEILKRMGIRWARDRISWNHVQPDKDKWDWSRYDAFQDIQSRANLRILQIFHDTAVWASEQKEGNAGFRQRFAPENTYDAFTFAEAMARHYTKQVSAWELWNEFDAPTFFLGSADEYTRILKAMSLGIRRGNPRATVLLGSVTFVSGEISWGGEVYYDKEGIRYIEKVLENGGGEFFDVFNVHHYGPVEGIVGKIKQCRDLMRRFGCQKPIWVTEMGSTSTEKMGPEVAESEREQARYLLKSYVLTLSHGAQRFFYFCLPSFVENGTSFWGILEETGSGWQPKPGLVALSNLLITLDGKKYSGSYNSRFPVEARVFSRGSEGTMVLWSRDGKEYRPIVFFKKKQERLFLRTLYGRERKREDLAVCTVSVGPDPVFLCNFNVYDLDARFIEKQEEEPLPPVGEFSGRLKDMWVEIRTAKKSLTSLSKNISGEVQVYNLSPVSSKGTLNLSLMIPSQEAQTVLSRETTVQPNEISRIPFEIPLDPELMKNLGKEQGKEIKFLAEFLDRASNMKTTPAARYLEILPPVEISAPSLLDAVSRDLVTTVTVKNLSEDSLSLSLSMDLDIRYRAMNSPVMVSLLKNEKKQIPFRLENVGRTLGDPFITRAVITADINGNKIVKKSLVEPNYILHALHAAPGFKIDGKPDDWKNFQPFTLEGKENFVHGQDLLETRGDFRGDVYLAWDEQALYLLSVIQDADVMNPLREMMPWTGDALEIFLDMRLGKDFRKKEYGPGVFQLFIVPPDKDHPEPFFKVWQPSGALFKGVELASQLLKDSYTLELRIPWENLTREKIQIDRIIGFEATLDDMDTGDFEQRQLVWRGGAGNYQNASLFTPLVLHVGKPWPDILDVPAKRFPSTE